MKIENVKHAPTWHEQALCQAHPDPDLWSYKGYQDVDDKEYQVLRLVEALEYCRDCPVREQCLQQGLEKENLVPGIIWGGLFTYERIKLLKNKNTHSFKNEFIIIRKVRKILNKGVKR